MEKLIHTRKIKRIQLRAAVFNRRMQRRSQQFFDGWSPEKRFILAAAFMAILAIASIYITGRSLYNIGSGDDAGGQKLPEIRHIEQPPLIPPKGGN